MVQWVPVVGRRGVLPARSAVRCMKRSVREYSERLSSARAGDQRAAIAGSLLQSAAVLIGAAEGAVWAPPGNLSGPPLATYPASIGPWGIRLARQAARQAAGGQRPDGPGVAVAVTGGGGGADAVFVFLRRGGSPFAPADRALLARLTPLLGVAVSAVALQDGASMLRAADPARATLDLLATLAHEMRTSLASIKGYATAILSGPEPWDQEKVREALQIVDHETSALTTLVSELLEAAAIDSGRLILQLEPVLLNRILQRLAGEFARVSPRHRFTVDFPPRWPVIRGDLRRLEQVFRNILDNAVKYSPHGGLIAIRGVVSPVEVLVSIADQGIGIAPEDLNRLFDKFFRARRAVRVAGSGLGLPIARAIVEEHGGRIWAESVLGRGTTLHVALPRRQRSVRRR